MKMWLLVDVEESQDEKKDLFLQLLLKKYSCLIWNVLTI